MQSSVSSGTPQHGVRSVPAPPDPNELRNVVAQVHALVTTPSMTPARYLTVAAKLQRAADLAWRLGARK